MPKSKNPHAVALGRLGGLEGGKRCLVTMTREERVARALKAVQARLKKAKSEGKKNKKRLGAASKAV